LLLVVVDVVVVVGASTTFSSFSNACLEALQTASGLPQERSQIYRRNAFSNK